MQRRCLHTVRTITLAAVVSVSAAAIAFAATTKLTITPVKHTPKGAVALARAMLANPKQLIGAQFVIAPPQNGPNAIGAGPKSTLDGFPIRGGHFAILSNGCSKRAAEPKYKGSFGCNDRGPEFHGTRDTTVFRVELDVPKTANCLSFRFRFLSNEWPKWVGYRYNDAFIAEQGYYFRWRSTATTPYLKVPDDFARTADGKLITVNQTGLGAMSKGNARGTGYNGGTRLLRASTPIKPGKRYVLFSIFDQGDRQFDSAAFVDNLTLTHTAACHSGVSKYQ